jgi:hypothetical protein
MLLFPESGPKKGLSGNDSTETVTLHLRSIGPNVQWNMSYFAQTVRAWFLPSCYECTETMRIEQMDPVWTLEWVFRGYVGIHRAQKAIQVDGCRPRRVSWLRFPWLSPLRNPCELRGLYRRSYFGPRTCGGGITNVIEVSGALNQGFPFSPLLREV